MIRADMISTVGRAYLTSNIENDEYSYPKAYAAASLTFVPIQNSAGRKFEKLDIRFVKENVSVLIETKQNFSAADEEQLSAYVEYEKALTGNKIIAILANTTNDNVKVWRGVISDGDLMPKETALRTMDEYVDFYTSKINDKEKVMQNTYKLNEMLHRHSIPEKLRSQFVGTCLRTEERSRLLHSFFDCCADQNPNQRSFGRSAQLGYKQSGKAGSAQPKRSRRSVCQTAYHCCFQRNTQVYRR